MKPANLKPIALGKKSTSTIFGKVGICSSDKSLKLNKKIVKLDRALKLMT